MQPIGDEDIVEARVREAECLGILPAPVERGEFVTLQSLVEIGDGAVSKGEPSEEIPFLAASTHGQPTEPRGARVALEYRRSDVFNESGTQRPAPNAPCASRYKAISANDGYALWRVM